MYMLPIESGWQAQYYSYSSIHKYLLNVEANYPSLGRFVTEWHLCQSITKVTFQECGQERINLLTPLCANQCQHYYSLERLLHLGVLRLKHFQPSMALSGELYIFSSCISSPSFVKVSGRTCDRSIQTSNSNHSLLEGGSLAGHSSLHVEDIPHLCPFQKISWGMSWLAGSLRVWHYCF